MRAPKAFAIASLACTFSIGAAGATELDLGQSIYVARCAPCHGSDAKGNGPLSTQLKTQPSDLTKLAQKNSGVFPVKAIYELIDGRPEVKAHGPRDMPIWGYKFMPLPSQSFSLETAPWGTAGDTEPEAVVRVRILALVDYLNRIQDR